MSLGLDPLVEGGIIRMGSSSVVVGVVVGGDVAVAVLEFECLEGCELGFPTLVD